MKIGLLILTLVLAQTGGLGACACLGCVGAGSCDDHRPAPQPKPDG